MSTTVHERRIAKIENLKVEIYSSAELAGEAAANATAEALRQIAAIRKTFGVILATGGSQLATLKALSRIDQLPWGHIQGFNMDDYVCLPADQPASFHTYLLDKLPQRGLM
jgi:glucosamine-6-phosphate deaminase